MAVYGKVSTHGVEEEQGVRGRGGERRRTRVHAVAGERQRGAQGRRWRQHSLEEARWHMVAWGGCAGARGGLLGMRDGGMQGWERRGRI